MAYYLEREDLNYIIDNFDTEVINILRKYRGFDDSIISYIGNKWLGANIVKFIFEWQYIDEQNNDRTLTIDICINMTSIDRENWVDNDAKIKPTLPDKTKAKLRFAYIIWHVWEDIEDSFDPMPQLPNLADEICNSTSDHLRALVFPNGGFKYEVIGK